MSGSLVYKTVQTGRVILYSLLEEVSDKPYFTCEVVTTVSTPDSVENAPVTLYVQRRTGAEHDYEHSNDDRVFKTQARLELDGESFDIDITTRSWQIDTTCATISMSRDMERIVQNILDRNE